MTTIIHVNRQHIAMNAKDGGRRPAYIVRSGRNGRSRYARELVVHGTTRFVSNGEQLPCGARAWIETNGKVELIDEMTFAEARAIAH